jgi:DNA-binding transcriptional regulator YiaG
MRQVSRVEFAKLLDGARKKQHVSIRGAAKIAGVKAATMQGWLTGRHFPTPSLRPRYLTLVSYLGLSEHIHPRIWIEPERNAS